ncbi:MAG TPA: hypothetical protein VHN14_35950 [Kofleriaceae bacterium]|nr:hypothetical protein [Kofleriaceae bacterium]
MSNRSLRTRSQMAATHVVWLARMTERRSVHEARAQYVYDR